MGQYDFSVTYPGSLGHVDRKVQNVVSHWKYDPKSYEYDVALLRFDEPVKFKPNVIPICLSDDNEDLAGQTGWITGWGTLYESKQFIHCKPCPCNENRYSLCPRETCFNHRENLLSLQGNLCTVSIQEQDMMALVCYIINTQ